MKKLLLIGALSSGATLMATQEAYAYLEPGTGSMLLQGLVAGLAATSVVVGHYWYKVKAFFTRRSDRNARDQVPDRGKR